MIVAMFVLAILFVIAIVVAVIAGATGDREFDAFGIGACIVAAVVGVTLSVLTMILFAQTVGAA